ncbi:MAG: tRNA lysidine(34) synthetase TilS, partial [Coriobacteriales bacterium]|nr:tRNA lysidine(34) synthetase TilS [Coriobacteriales bacterium]
GRLEFELVDCGKLKCDPVAFARADATKHRAYIDIDPARLAGLSLTAPRTGDRMCPLGMGGCHRLVSDVLIDRKLPARLRSSVPVLRDGDAIVWLVGIQPDERYKVTATSNTMVRVTYREDQT